MNDALSDSFPASSADKIAHLLSDTRSGQVAADWEIPIQTPHGIKLSKVSASRLGGALFVIAAVGATDAYELYDELIRINNEQSTQLRNAMKQIARQRHEGVAQPDKMYEELTKLANELGTVQRQLAKKNAQLRVANERKDQILGMVAHDLRNPLGTIAGFTTIVLRRCGDTIDPRSRHMLERVHSASTFMRALVEDLLDVSAIESGHIALHRETASIDEVLEEVAEALRPVASDKDIDIVVDSEPVEVLVDARKLHQVVANLITNGVKYSEAGTTVRIEARREGPHVRVAVIDQGQGIPAGEQAQLFTMFGTTSVRGTAGEQSTGLGLAIAKKVVEAHGGTIGVVSAVGEGSTFWFALPMRGADA